MKINLIQIAWCLKITHAQLMAAISMLLLMKRGNWRTFQCSYVLEVINVDSVSSHSKFGVPVLWIYCVLFLIVISLVFCRHRRCIIIIVLLIDWLFKEKWKNILYITRIWFFDFVYIFLLLLFRNYNINPVTSLHFKQCISLNFLKVSFWPTL